MIWVTWRQFRGTILAGVMIPLLVAAVVAAVTGFADRIGSNYVLFRCFGLSTTTCLAESTLTLSSLATIALPVMLGVFVGVTIFSRDIERGTHVLGLTQSIGRMRWYWTRVLVVFPPIVLAMAVLGYVVLWSRFGTSPYGPSFVDMYYSRLEFPTFGTIASAPAGYTLLGLTIGATAALLVRNTIGAMMITVVCTTAMIIIFPLSIREHYASPDITRQALEISESNASVAYEMNPDNTERPGWKVGTHYVDSAGAQVDLGYDECSRNDNDWPEPADDETTSNFDDRVDAYIEESDRIRIACLRDLGIDHFETRSFADRQLWRFQFTEAALCLFVAAALAGSSTLIVRRLQP